MEYRVKKINREIDRITQNSPYTLNQTQDILINLLEEVEDTGN